MRDLAVSCASTRLPMLKIDNLLLLMLLADNTIASPSFSITGMVLASLMRVASRLTAA